MSKMFEALHDLDRGGWKGKRKPKRGHSYISKNERDKRGKQDTYPLSVLGRLYNSFTARPGGGRKRKEIRYESKKKEKGKRVLSSSGVCTHKWKENGRKETGQGPRRVKRKKNGKEEIQNMPLIPRHRPPHYSEGEEKGKKEGKSKLIRRSMIYQEPSVIFPKEEGPPPKEKGGGRTYCQMSRMGKKKGGSSGLEIHLCPLYGRGGGKHGGTERGNASDSVGEGPIRKGKRMRVWT